MLTHFRQVGGRSDCVIMLRCHLVRHGETWWNREKRLQGWENTELSDVGIAQAKQVGLFLKNQFPQGFHSVISSDLARTMHTTRLILEAMECNDDCVIKQEPRLRERNLGVIQGKTMAECARNSEFNRIWKKISRDPTFQIPNGESSHDVQKRVAHALRDIAETYSSDIKSDDLVLDILIIGHGGSIGSIYDNMDDDPAQVGGSHVANGSLSTVVCAKREKNKHHWSVESWNCTAHLDSITNTKVL